MAYDHSMRTILNTGKAKGVKRSQVGRIRAWLAKGIPPEKISDDLLVDIDCIRSFVPKPEVETVERIRESTKHARRDN